MRPASTPPESSPPLPIASRWMASALRGLSPVPGAVCSNGVAQAVPGASLLPTVGRSRESLSLQRLPQPATAFPTPGVGCFHQTTPSQGRAGGGAIGGGRARLGLDRCGTLAHPHGRQLHPYFTLLFPFRVLTLDIEGLSICHSAEPGYRVRRRPPPDLLA